MWGISLYAQTLNKDVFRLINLDYPGLVEVKNACTQGDTIKAAHALLDYYRNRTNVKQPEIDMEHITVSDKERQMADEALSHILYAHEGYQPSFYYGKDIDWTYWPVQDNELRWHLHRHGWFVPMGKMYYTTHDEKYAKEWTSQFIDWIKKNPCVDVTKEEFELTSTGEVRDVAENARFAWRPLEISTRMENQIPQFMLFRNSPSFTPEFLSEFLVNYHKHVDYVIRHYSDGGNHLLFEAQRVFYGGTFFPEFEDAPAWRKSGIDVLAREIKKQVYDDGGQFELDPLYHMASIEIFCKALLMADMNGTKENLALTKYLGNARKFDVCNMFLTPAINNLTPRVRCFPTGDQKSGYCSCQMQKDPAKAAEIIRSVDPRSITFVRTEAGAQPVPLYIKPTSWIRGIYAKGLEPGSYGYDTKSTATFSIGQNDNGVPFSFERFIMATSGGLSHELPKKIDRFFEEWDAEGSDEQEKLPGEDYGRIRIADQCRRIERARGMGLTWREIAAIEGEAMTTVQSRFYKFTGDYPSSKQNTSRTLTNDETKENRACADIYNQKREGEARGPSSSAGGELRCSGGRRRKLKRRVGSNRRAKPERRGGGPARIVARMHRKVGGNVHGRRSVNRHSRLRRSNSNR